MILESYYSNGKKVYYNGKFSPEDADLHLKIDEIKRFREHGDLYYLIKIFLKPGIKMTGRYYLFSELLSDRRNNNIFDYYEAVCKYYRKHVRKFIKQNKDSTIEIDCKNVDRGSMPMILVDCIEKDMGAAFTENHIVVSSHKDFYGKSIACWFSGRIRRFK